MGCQERGAPIVGLEGKKSIKAFCSKEELWDTVIDEEMKIPWRAANEAPPVPEEKYQERFWRRRLDGIGLDTSN
jgi:hypothetical protein